MSLLKRNKSNLRRTVLGLMLAVLLLAVPCVAAAAWAIHFNVDSPFGQTQEPSREAQEKRERNERIEREVKQQWEREATELRQRIEQEPNAQVKAELEKKLRQLEEQKPKVAFTMNGEAYAQELRQRLEKETNAQVRAELEKKLAEVEEARAKGGYTMTGEAFLLTAKVNEEGARQEREIQEKRNTELARAAKISMDQAIQIATSKTPGKVLECSLVGEHWEGPGELAKPGLVLYHVVILSGDEPTQMTNHVLVNAVDGTIFRTEKQERRTEAPYMKPYMQSEPRLIEGGKLNGKALSLPEAVYPEMARSVRAQGDVDVRITIDEGGNVVSATAVSGHPLLRAAAVSAAREAKFNPTRLSGEPVKVSGVLTYNFLVQ